MKRRSWFEAVVQFQRSGEWFIVVAGGSSLKDVREAVCWWIYEQHQDEDFFFGGTPPAYWVHQFRTWKGVVPFDLPAPVAV